MSVQTQARIEPSTGAPVPTPLPCPIVRIQRLIKRYKRRVAVDNVGLEVCRGEIYGLIGPDGAGKSSVLRAVAGVLTIDEGDVELFGTRIVDEASAERVKGQLGFMPQGLGLNLYPDLTVEENVDYFARLRLVPEEALADRKRRLMAMTRLEPFRDRPMRNLSGGMKQKLGLICTLIHEPELIILDEPTTGVDPVSRRDFWAILAELISERGMTALISTAYLDEASRFHRLSLMHGGRVVAEGEPEALRALVPGTVVSVRANDQPAVLHALQLSFPQVEAIADEVRVFTEEPDARLSEELVARAIEGQPDAQLTAGPAELEDVFVALLQREGGTTEEDHHDLIDSAITGRVASSHATIEAHGLTRSFGRFVAADRVSFRVETGEIFGLLGANGAGKTTVIKMLIGILNPTSGTGHVAGKDVALGGMEIKRRIGYVSQAFSLYQDLTAIENLRLYAGIYGLSRREARERTEWVVRLAGLSGHEDALSGGLPMGLRQRLALGCALIHSPHVLFLDEPTSGVDPIGRRAFWDILFDLSRREGVTILVTTHYMSEAEHCDHLALMSAGRIVADATPREMKRQVQEEAGSLLEIDAAQPAAAARLLGQAGFEEPALYGRHVHILSRHPESDAERIPPLLTEAGGVRAVTRRPITMEDVFVYRARQAERGALGAVA